MTLPSPSGYRVVLFDPPWKYRAQGTRLAPSYAGKGRAAAHYEPMSDEAIAEYLAAVEPQLAPAAIGLMWITNSALLEARHVPLLAALKMQAAQVIPWIKTSASGGVRMGGGNYTRVVSEHLILAQRRRDDTLVGTIEEVDLLNSLLDAHNHKAGQTIDSLVQNAKAVFPPDTPLDDAMGLLTEGYALIVAEGSKPTGILTKIDVLDYLVGKI